MSTFDRFKRLAQSYLNDMSERIREIDRDVAERELDEDRIEKMIEERSARDLAASTPPENTPQSTQAPALSPAIEIASAYRVLRVAEGSEFALVRAAYYRAIRRADPSKFEADPDVKKQAEDIRNRLDSAYETLRAALDPGARRFKHLEIE